MFKKEDNFQPERQWSLLEEYCINGKPISARVLEIVKGHMLVDVGGIQGFVEQFTFAFTGDLSKEAPEEIQRSTEQLVQQELKNMRGKDILLRVIEVDQKNQHLKLSQQLYPNGELKPGYQRLLDELRIDDVCKGVVTSISASFVSIDLGGIIGKLPSKQPIDQLGFTDLSTILHIGQEIKVTIIKKRRNTFWLSLREF